MSPVRKQFAGPVRVPVQKPTRPAPPPPDAADDEDDDERLIRNIERPGWSDYVHAGRYDAMQAALLRVIPSAQPGLAQPDIFRKVLRHLPAALYPGGAKAQWWAKTVLLDLEFRKVLTRTSVAADDAPRWFRTAPVSIVQPQPKAAWELNEDAGARKRPHRHERRVVAEPAPSKGPRKGPPRRPKGPQN